MRYEVTFRTGETHVGTISVQAADVAEVDEQVTDFLDQPRTDVRLTGGVIVDKRTITGYDVRQVES